MAVKLEVSLTKKLAMVMVTVMVVVVVIVMTVVVMVVVVVVGGGGDGGGDGGGGGQSPSLPMCLAYPACCPPSGLGTFSEPGAVVTRELKTFWVTC